MAAPLHRRLVGLQYCRAVAAVGVLVFHAGQMSGIDFRIGAWGVALFFVLSGFIMVAITDGATRAMPFIRDRVVRIVPLYWLATAAMVVLLWTQIIWGTPLSKSWVAASFAFIPADSPGGEGPFPVLNVGWTLNLEMVFYALFAIALLLLPRRFQVAALSIVLLALVLAGWAAEPASAALRGWTHPILLNFVLGMWLGHAWQAGWRLGPMAAASAGLAVVCMVLAAAGTLGWAVAAMFVMLLAVILVLMLERVGRVSRWRWGELLGDASYSIYLFQPFVLMAWWATLRRLPLPPLLDALAIVVMGIGAGVTIFYLVERPLLGAFRRPRRA